MKAGKVKTFKHLGLYDSLYRNKLPGRKFLEKISNEWSSFGTRNRSPYGNSFFGQSLFHVQLLKNVYGIRKRSFLKQLAFKSKEKRGDKSTNLLNLLENKLDYFLFNAGYVKSLVRAKELIETGNVEVNKDLVRNSTFILKPTDKVSLRGHNPLISGETRYNVASGLSMPTQWSLYLELLEDTLLFSSVHKLQNVPSRASLSETTTEFSLSTVNTDNTSDFLAGLATSVPNNNNVIKIKSKHVFEKKRHVFISLENNFSSKRYLSTISYLLKTRRDLFENQDVQMKKYIANSIITSLSCGGLERYVTMSLLFSDLSLLKPVWGDCLDQVTSDLATDLRLNLDSSFVKTDFSEADQYVSGFYENNSFSEEGELPSATFDDDLQEDFSGPQSEEFELTEELEGIRENADYYSQLEIDVVEGRSPYMSSYLSVKNIHENYIQKVALEKESNPYAEKLGFPGEGLVEYSETLLASDYYTDLIFLENEDSFVDCLLSSDYMSMAVILRDKKEGSQFNLLSRSPEVTGEGFYLDPELWELRSRLCEGFSESKIDSAEHVIKTTR